MFTKIVVMVMLHVKTLWILAILTIIYAIFCNYIKNRYQITIPPFTARTCPVIYSADEEARNDTESAI